MANESTSQLRRVLSFWDVFFIAVGQVIGAGVIALTGVAIGMTGPSVIYAYLIAAVLAILSSVLVMVAGATLPAVGAFYSWPSRLCNGWLGSVTLMLILLGSISLSLYGSAFGLYLEPLFPILSVNQWGVLVVVVLFAANLFGLKMAARFQQVLVLLLVSALALYAGFALPKVQLDSLVPMYPNGAMGFLTAIFLVKFATGGASLIAGLGAEINDPARTIPLVIIFATLSVAVIYALIALASVGVVPWRDMIDQPLTVAGRAFLPAWALVYFIIAGAGLAVCTTLNAQFMHLPRNFMVAGWDQLLPEWVGRLNRHGAPHFVLLAMLLVGVVPLVLGMDIATIARAATIAASLPAFIVYWSITRIPKRFPEAYSRSLFRLSNAWLWAFFCWSVVSTLIGVGFLGRDLSLEVWVVLLGWLAISILYYPARRYYLAKQGTDLDLSTASLSVFGMDDLADAATSSSGKPV